MYSKSLTLSLFRSANYVCLLAQKIGWRPLFLFTNCTKLLLKSHTFSCLPPFRTEVTVLCVLPGVVRSTICSAEGFYIVDRTRLDLLVVAGTSPCLLTPKSQNPPRSTNIKKFPGNAVPVVLVPRHSSPEPITSSQLYLVPFVRTGAPLPSQ